MTASFEQLKTRAQQRWNELTAGALPWIRVGGGVSGEAAGAHEVTLALNKAIEKANRRANVTRVGMLGLCSRSLWSTCSSPAGTGSSMPM